MSDAMMFGIAAMPYEIAMSDEISRRQFYENTQRLVAALEAARAEIETLLAEVAEWKRVAAARGEAEASAERLAEAINAYKSEWDNPVKDYLLRAKRRDEMFALLSDKEEKK